MTRRSLISLAALPILAEQTQFPTAPDFVGDHWLNTPGGSPLSLSARRGKLTVVHFWTYACYNCKNNMPIYNRWYDEFKSQDVEIVGIHTPETPEESRPAFVAQHIQKYGVKYPVVLDNDKVNWRRWKQQYWPMVYAVDKHGKIRADWAGELEYKGAGGSEKLAGVFRSLLREA